MSRCIWPLIDLDWSFHHFLSASLHTHAYSSDLFYNKFSWTTGLKVHWSKHFITARRAIPPSSWYAKVVWRLWMSSGREFQRTDSATGNERRPTVERRNDGTRSECVDDGRSRRRLGLQYGLAGSGMMERDRAARDTPRRPYICVLWFPLEPSEIHNHIILMLYELIKCYNLVVCWCWKPTVLETLCWSLCADGLNQVDNSWTHLDCHSRPVRISVRQLLLL